MQGALERTLCKSCWLGQAGARGSSGSPKATHLDLEWGAGETLPSTPASKGLEDIPGMLGVERGPGRDAQKVHLRRGVEGGEEPGLPDWAGGEGRGIWGA